MTATTKELLATWFDSGVAQGATHMVVVCDTFDYEDYPVYVSPNQDVGQVFREYDGPNMAKVMEVYDLAKDRDSQLNEWRVFNF